MTIHLTKYGKGFPIVFFHGWGFDSSIWHPLIPHLEDKYQLILIDLPGFGASNTMNWACFKDQLEQILPEEFGVAGWSLGGLFATRLAAELALRVRFLLNISSSPRFLEDALWPGVNEQIFQNFYKNLIGNTHQTLQEFVRLQSNNQRVELSMERLPSSAALLSGLDVLNTWDLRDQLTTLQQPTCYFFGRLDPITPVSTMKMMQKEYPNFSYVLFNRAAHMPFMSHCQEFVRQVRSFFV